MASMNQPEDVTPSPSSSTPPHFRWQDLDIFDSPQHPARKPFFPPRKSTPPSPPPTFSRVEALFASAVLPGLGSLINGRHKTGLLILLPWVVLFPLFLLTVRDFIGLALLPFLAYLWGLSLYEAYHSARRR
jgi:hypothetical protein